MKRDRCSPITQALLFVVLLHFPTFAAELSSAQLAAGDLRLTVRRSAEGMEVERLLDAKTGQDLLAGHTAPLFSITLRQGRSTDELRLTADAGWRQCAIQPRRGRVELRWSQPTNEALAGISVIAKVSADARASAFRWKLTVENSSSNWSVWRVIFPDVALADLGSNAAVLFPRGPGEVQRGIWARPFKYRGNYPSGWCSMQFAAAYREGENPTGLYVAVEDPWGATKDLEIEGVPASRTVRLGFEHPAPDMGVGSNGFQFEGEAVWQLLRGDWFDAATIYRRWARAHARWWPRRTSEGRGDTPGWMRDLNAWAMTGGAPADCVPAVKEFRLFLGVPIGFHWYNWHQIPFDNDYPHYFPAKDGFAEGVADLKSNGVFVMPYINGRLWDSHDRGSADFEFSRVALPAVTKQPDGSPYLEQYGSKETNGEPVRLGVMCPTTGLWQSTVSNVVIRLLRECGTSGVYIDQVAAAAPKLCMDHAHGHALGGGHWWNEGYWKLLSRIRRAMPNGTMLTTECNGEPFIRWFDGYLTWHWQFDGQVPAFPAIYGGTIQMFGRAYRGGSTKALALRMKAGQQLVFGEQLGWIDPAIVKEKESADFFRQMVQVRAKFNRYFSAGEMAHPPKLAGAIPDVRADWQWSGEWWVTNSAVLTGAWQLPKEKRMVLLFVNVSEDSVSATLRFDNSEYGIHAKQVRLQRSTATTTEAGWQTNAASFERSITFAPRQAGAWEVRW